MSDRSTLGSIKRRRSRLPARTVSRTVLERSQHAELGDIIFSHCHYSGSTGPIRNSRSGDGNRLCIICRIFDRRCHQLRRELHDWPAPSCGLGRKFESEQVKPSPEGLVSALCSILGDREAASLPRRSGKNKVRVRIEVAIFETFQPDRTHGVIPSLERCF
jgi:hypothetical protein